MSTLDQVLASDQAQTLGTGYAFAEGPLWDPAGFYYFADVRSDLLYRVAVGQAPEVVRKTDNGNGCTFDLQGRLIQCEGNARRLTRWDPRTGEATVLADRAEGRRLNRPNDVVCRSDGSLLFTDPALRIPIAERENESAIWRVAPDGSVHLVAYCEYPNGLAFSPDERRLYVANTRTLKYLQVLELDAHGEVSGRRIFADMSFDDAPGVPDGVKVDSLGRVFCAGPGGISVFSLDGEFISKIACPEPAVNFCFGGRDMRSLFVCAHSSVYLFQLVHPGLARKGQP